MTTGTETATPVALDAGTTTPGATELQALGRSLKQAQYRHHLALDRALAAVGTTIVQWDALRAIDEAPGASGHDLATTTFQSDQSFGTLANRLEARGLIERAPGQGRRIGHRLTAEGRRMLATGNEIANVTLAESFEPLDGRDRENLAILLAKISRRGSHRP